MTEFEQRASGLSVPKSAPKAAPKAPNRKLHVHEVQDPERREAVRKALNDLWNALNLSNPHRFSDAATTWELHYLCYRHLGEILLGDDCPEREVNC